MNTNNEHALTSHPKPLAFTEASGVSFLRKAVYRSTELRAYCNSISKDPNALYESYTSNPDVVVLDDNTLVLERIQHTTTLAPPITSVNVKEELSNMKSDFNEEVIQMLIKAGLL